jgi:hypothetical protein
LFAPWLSDQPEASLQEIQFSCLLLLYVVLKARYCSEKSRAKVIFRTNAGFSQDSLPLSEIFKRFCISFSVHRFKTPMSKPLIDTRISLCQHNPESKAASIITHNLKEHLSRHWL